MAYQTTSPYQLSDDLVTSVQRGSRLPLYQNTILPSDILAFLSEETDLSVVPLVHNVREDYWLQNYDQQIQTNVFSYPMPNRAISGALRDIVFVDASGNEIEVAHLDPDQLKTPAYFSYRPAFLSQGAFIQNDQVMLWPTTYNNSAYLLRQKYERRPNTLTLSANCSLITGVNVSANQISFGASPGGAGFAVGASLDIISAKGQFQSQGDNLLISALAGSLLTFDPSTPISSSVTVGSWACPAGLTCVPQIPKEGYSLLVQLGIMRVHMAMQNSNGFQVTAKIAEDMKVSLQNLLTPRIPGSPKKFVNRSTWWGSFSFPWYR